MTNYIPKPGDIVNFKNPSTNRYQRGIVSGYLPGKSTNTGNERDVLVKFNSPTRDGGPLEIWCAIKDLTLIWPTLRKVNEMKPTVTYTSSSTSTTTDYGDYNIQLQKNDKMAQSTFSDADRPWTKYYVTADEFFDVLRIAYDDTYGGGSDTPWHPEDMYVNVSCVLEIVSNTLVNMANLKSGRQLKGIKES